MDYYPFLPSTPWETGLQTHFTVWKFQICNLLLREVLSMVETKTILTIMTCPMQTKPLRPNDIQYYSPTAALIDNYHSCPAISVWFLPYHSASMIFLSLFSCNVSALGETVTTTESYKHFSILLLWHQLPSVTWKRFYIMLFTEFLFCVL